MDSEDTLDSMELGEAEQPLMTKPKGKRARRSKPKVRAEWSEDDINKLIGCVESSPSLWNASDENYSNSIVRQNAWESIANQFDTKFTNDELNAKWTNLRIQFRSYNARKTKSGQGAESNVKWKYFNAMSFVGAAEEFQREGSISNMSFDEESDGKFFREIREYLKLLILIIF